MYGKDLETRTEKKIVRTSGRSIQLPSICSKGKTDGWETFDDSTPAIHPRETFLEERSLVEYEEIPS